jgi:CheY-like chemotaxis protein
VGKIAVVVADPQERALIAAAARSSGHDVVERDRARGALDVVLPADVLIVGADLPDGHGLDLVARLRLLETPSLPVVLVSADPLDANRGRSVGAQQHLLRPLDPERVRAVLARAQVKEEPIGLELPREGGLVFGRYTLHRLLGRGSFGAVYEAWDAGRGGPIALKVLEPVVDDPQDLARFVREAQVLSTIDDPHVVSMLDAGLVEGRAFCAMRLVRGPTLDFRILTEGPLTERQGLALLWGLLRALHSVAAAGLVHRDVTPRNVILEGARATRPVLIDFGLARATHSDQGLTGPDVILGTPGYVAPEFVQGDPVDVRSDLFSAGLVALYSLAGRHPFDSLRGLPLLRAMAERPAPVPEHLSPGTRALLERLTAIDPAARFARPTDALLELGRLATKCSGRYARPTA